MHERAHRAKAYQRTASACGLCIDKSLNRGREALELAIETDCLSLQNNLQYVVLIIWAPEGTIDHKQFALKCLEFPHTISRPHLTHAPSYYQQQLEAASHLQ